jgi:outer membrane protein assembly factor BamA
MNPPDRRPSPFHGRKTSRLLVTVIVCVAASFLPSRLPGQVAPTPPPGDTVAAKTELLPIISYDTDTGFGYGLKFFALNHLGIRESFDLVLFNSTKGERWYRLVFSLPDFELRQGSAYPLALDIVVDYDKWVANSFFGIGNGSQFSDREIYTREPLEITLIAARGFTPHAVGQIGLRYRAVRNFNFEPGSRLAALSPDLNASRASSASLVLTLRHDTRNSYVNASEGVVLQGEVELAPETCMSNVSFVRVAAGVQNYTRVRPLNSVLATRVSLEGLSAGEIPVQMLLPVGGNKTVRGLVQDRYLDKFSAVANIELRFPVFWRIGGVAGFDAGKVWHAPGKIDLPRWATNPVFGLRLYMDTFVVRLDAGLGKETTGFFLNFGQLF